MTILKFVTKIYFSIKPILTRSYLALNTLQTLKCVAVDAVELDTSIAQKMCFDSISISLTIN